MAFFDWLIEKNNEAGQNIRDFGGSLLKINNDMGATVRQGPLAVNNALGKMVREGPLVSGWSELMTGTSPRKQAENNSAQQQSKQLNPTNQVGYANGMVDQWALNGGQGGGEGSSSTAVDPSAGLRDRLLAELGNKRSFEDLGFSAMLDTSGVDSAYKSSQKQLADALNRSVSGIGKAKGTAKQNYGDASGEIQNYYDANVDDVRNTKAQVEKSASGITNEMQANQADIMKQLQASDSAMAQEAQLRGKATGGPRGGESNILQQAQGDIAATNSEQINNSIAEKGRRTDQVDRNALALQSEGGNAVGNIEAMLASVLSGLDTRESDVRTTFAQSDAALGGQYQDRILNANMARDQAMFNAKNQFQQTEDSRGMSLLQMLLQNDQTSQETAYNQYASEQESQQKQMYAASKGDEKMKEILLQEYAKSLGKNDPKKLQEITGLNINLGQ